MAWTLKVTEGGKKPETLEFLRELESRGKFIQELAEEPHLDEYLQAYMEHFVVLSSFREQGNPIGLATMHEYFDRYVDDDDCEFFVRCMRSLDRVILNGHHKD